MPGESEALNLLDLGVQLAQLLRVLVLLCLVGLCIFFNDSDNCGKDYDLSS